MKSLFNRAALIATVFLVGACSTVYRGNVSTFHEMTTPGGERVMITPMLADKTDSLEFKQYANVLAGHLATRGYQEPGEGEPELIAGFDVVITDGREKLATRPNPHPFWGRGYWSYGYFWSPVYAPFRGPFDDDQLVARTVYTATLRLELRKPDGEMVYEGRAELETRRKDLPAIMPYLAEALFERFPGENGKTQKVRIEVEKNAAAE
jgi:hypothetical protein